MSERSVLALILCVVLATLRNSRAVPEGLDPTIFGSILDLSTRRTVLSGEDLRAYLLDVTVSTLLLNGEPYCNPLLFAC